MAVKIELEKNEIAEIVGALNVMAHDRGRVAETGRMNGKKISKEATLAARRRQKRIEKLRDFFKGLL